jgi:hypothetical protein
VALPLAGALLLVGLLATLLITGGIPTAHADGPVLTVSSSTTNPGGTVTVSGSGWAPAKHYDLYVYGQSKCRPNPICAPPEGTKKINSRPVNITSGGNLSKFDFTFIPKAGATTYVFTVIADYPADTPFSASVLVQVVPAGTPPSGTPVSSSPTAAPTSAPTTAVPASPTTTNQNGATPGNQSTNTPTGGNTLAIVVVIILLLIAIIVLIGLLIVLPPKRRAIRAAWYGASPGGTGGRRYGASGPAGPGPRRTTGGYPPIGEQEPPAWMGGVAQWDDEPRSPRGSRPLPPRPPRRPPGSDY